MLASLVAGAVMAGTGQAGPAAVGAGAGDAAYVCYYFDEARELTLDTTRVAVFGTGTRNVRGADLGVPGAAVEYLAIPNVQFVEMPAGERTRDRVERALDDASSLRAPSVGYVAPVFVGLDGGYVVPTRSILVRFAPGTGRAERESRLAKLGTVTDRDWGGIEGAYRVTPNATDGRGVLDAAAELARRDDTLFAEPDMLFTGSNSLIPGDDRFFDCWGLYNIGQSVGGIGVVDVDMDVEKAWDITLGDAGTLTLIIDVGVDPTHLDIGMTGGMDFTTDGIADGGPGNQCDNHGTPVAGCVSGLLNGAGTVGVAPATRSVSARTFISSLSCDGTWTSTASWTVDALAHGETLGCRVTNNSNFYGFTSSAISTKYFTTRTTGPGMVHFSSAGNFGSTTLTYPATLPTVNAISAIDNRGTIASFSNRGPSLFMCGPGLDVWSTDRKGAPGYELNSYVLIDGTSFASPMVAGVAALVLSYNPGLTADQVEEILRTTSKDLGTAGFDELFGWGLPDADAALEAATTCVGDCDGSGELNVDDIDCFVTGFLGGDLGVADCDHSGVLNVDDIECFVAAFLGGCP
ncbi:MAG: hypothetical protein DHS20C14_04040 [Phycisphaeraceae bacterium]|nr:MAG: hypothetical protein DHS20C14_04040 [Phycisphaeraceae bacterium]